MRKYITIVALGLVAAAIAVPAQAGNGNSGGSASTTSSISLNGTASFGGSASFTVVDPPVKGLPEMSVNCWQGDQNVYLGVQMMSGPSPYAPTFTLWSSTWAANGGGPANCTASLFYYTWQGQRETGIVYMATSSFTAS
jgi:hypothetical protein